MIPWILGIAVTMMSLVVWLSQLASTGLTAYSLFPLFGLLAFSLMWTHYVYGVAIVGLGWPRSTSYKKASELMVLFCLWLHPGILLYQLWIDRQLLPPDSIIDYLGKANAPFITVTLAAWLAFLTYDVVVRFKDRPFWKKHWLWVSVSQALAMIIIYLHAIRLGRHVQVEWFKAYWAFLGVTLLMSIVYLLWKELPKKSKVKGGIQNMMKNKTLVAVSIVGALLLLGAGAYVMGQREAAETTETSTSTTQQQPTATEPASTITLAQVEQNNGKNGAKCWVIVDTTVYEISGFAQWVDGVHTSSGGKARCGKDQTDVIGDSPHGRSVLRLLTVVGTYQQ